MKGCVSPARRERGFSFIEVILSVALLAFALISLAQLFLLGMANNFRADQVSNAAFLAQQELDELRTMTADELNAMGNSPMGEMKDVNNDTIGDYVRIARLSPQGMNWTVDIWIFPASQAILAGGSVTNSTELINNPQQNRVRAQISSVICR
ncbi:MAG TPA: prepilin-type N-terminal cleavage/methylation domain-containing protein [Acidobacteriota bacterium]